MKPVVNLIVKYFPLVKTNEVYSHSKINKTIKNQSTNKLLKFIDNIETTIKLCETSVSKKQMDNFKLQNLMVSLVLLKRDRFSTEYQQYQGWI